MRLFIVFVLALFCTKEAASQDPHKALLFVPGFKGSKLIEVGSRRTVWVSAQEAIFGSRSLTLSHKAFPFTSELNLEPVSVLRTVPFIPKLFERALYGDFLNFLNSDLGKGYRIVEIPYDWRRSNTNTSTRIQNELRRLIESGYDEIVIIAHSMGGLGVTHALKQLVTADANPLTNLRSLKIIYVGTPFAGAPSILGDLTRRSSSTVILNSKLLDQRAFCSFESSYELLPLLKHVGEFELTDTSVWLSNRLGCFNERPVDKEGYLEFLTTALPHARTLQEEVNNPITLSRKIPVKVLNLIGTSLSTSNTCVLKTANDPDSLNCTAPDDLKNGDGVVTVDAATLTPFLMQFEHGQKYFSRAGHLELLFEDEPRVEMKKFLSSEFAAPSS